MNVSADGLLGVAVAVAVAVAGDASASRSPPPPPPPPSPRPSPRTSGDEAAMVTSPADKQNRNAKPLARSARQVPNPATLPNRTRVYLPALVSAQERRGCLAGGCGDSVSLSSAISENTGRCCCAALPAAVWFGFQLLWREGEGRGGSARAASRDETRGEERREEETAAVSEGSVKRSGGYIYAWRLPSSGRSLGNGRPACALFKSKRSTVVVGVKAVSLRWHWQWPPCHGSGRWHAWDIFWPFWRSLAGAPGFYHTRLSQCLG